MHAANRSEAVTLLANLPQANAPLWTEAAKAGLSGQLYDDISQDESPFPKEADTMGAWTHLTNVQQLLKRVIANEIEGDFLEAGVWRGGVSMFARAIFDLHGQSERAVWVADSFRGLPPPSMARDFESDWGMPAYWSKIRSDQ